MRRTEIPLWRRIGSEVGFGGLAGDPEGAVLLEPDEDGAVQAEVADGAWAG